MTRQVTRGSGDHPHARTVGSCGGVGNPALFAPLSDAIDNSTHYIRSDTEPANSLVPDKDKIGNLVESLTDIRGIDEKSGWWTMDQSNDTWWGTGLESFEQQIWAGAEDHEFVSNSHSHSTGVWATTLGNALPGIEAVFFSLQPHADSSEESSSGGSVRFPTVTLLLSDPEPESLERVTDTIELAFYEGNGPEKALAGHAEHAEFQIGYEEILFDNRSATTESFSEDNNSQSNVQALLSRLGFELNESQESNAPQEEREPIRPRTTCVDVIDTPEGPRAIIENPYFARQRAAVDNADVDEGPDGTEILRERAVKTFAAHSHLATQPVQETETINPGDVVRITRVDATKLRGVGFDLNPTSVIVEVEPVRA